MPCFFLALPSELAVTVAIATLDLHLLLLLTNELIVAVLAVLAPKAVADPPNLMFSNGICGTAPNGTRSRTYSA